MSKPKPEPYADLRVDPDPRRRPARAVVAGALAMVLVVLATSVSVAPATAVEDGDRVAAHQASTWLAGRLEAGTYVHPLGGGPDHGLMLDAVLAMHASGDGHLAEPILEVLDDRGRIVDYISYAAWLPGGEADRIAGATAKSLVAALVGGRDPHDFGGVDLVADTLATVTPDGPERGRVRDHGPHITSNNANTFDQALAVVGLAGVDRLEDPAVLAMLVHQQCAEGYFRIFYSYGPDHQPDDCDEGKAQGRSHPDGDSTGIALSALVAARRAGAPGLDAPIDLAVAWLVAAQHPGGGWGGGVGTEAPNTNSTGLIVQALADAGGPAGNVRRGIDYLASAQASATVDGTGALASDVGAVAYDHAGYRAARTTGIVHPDVWIRATAQAALGFAQVGVADLVAGVAPPTPPTVPPSTTTTVPSAITTSVPGQADSPSATVAEARPRSAGAPSGGSRSAVRDSAPGAVPASRSAAAVGGSDRSASSGGTVGDAGGSSDHVDPEPVDRPGSQAPRRPEAHPTGSGQRSELAIGSSRSGNRPGWWAPAAMGSTFLLTAGGYLALRRRADR